MVSRVPGSFEYTIKKHLLPYTMCFLIRSSNWKNCLWNVNICSELDMVTFCFRSLRREDSFVFRESPASWKWRCVSHLVIRLWQCCVQWPKRNRKWIQGSTSCLTNCSSRYSRTFLTMTTGASDWWTIVSRGCPTTNHCGERLVYRTVSFITTNWNRLVVITTSKKTSS